MSSLFCIYCGRPLEPSAPRCAGCDALVVPVPDDTTVEVVGGATLVADLLAAQRVERVRRQLPLASGETAVVITRGPSEGSWYKLSGERLTLGRDASADVLLDDISVSRHHAEIRHGPAGYQLVDTGSLNGTYVNRSPVQEANLADGDEIQVGLFRLLFIEGADRRSAGGRRLRGGR